jgi:hypothetical protein
MSDGTRGTRFVDFRTAVEKAARELVSVQHRQHGSFVVVPSMYPSGASAVVKVERRGNTFSVSDFSFAYHEAQQSGGSHIFARQARGIADRAGVSFDGQSFQVEGIEADGLASVISAVSSVSVEAANIVDHRIAEQKFAAAAERLYMRLVSLFTAEAVRRDVEFAGASNTKWHFATSVMSEKGRPVTLFEPVTNHHNSVANVSMKFRDIGLLENAPGRVSVVHSKKALGTYLGVLTQTSSVVEDTVSNAALLKLAA